MAIRIAGRTLAERTSLGTDTPFGEMTAPAPHAVTIFIVLASLASAIVIWRRDC